MKVDNYRIFFINALVEPRSLESPSGSGPHHGARSVLGYEGRLDRVVFFVGWLDIAVGGILAWVGLANWSTPPMMGVGSALKHGVGMGERQWVGGCRNGLWLRNDGSVSL